MIGVRDYTSEEMQLEPAVEAEPSPDEINTMLDDERDARVAEDYCKRHGLVMVPRVTADAAWDEATKRAFA